MLHWSCKSLRKKVALLTDLATMQPIASQEAKANSCCASHAPAMVNSSVTSGGSLVSVRSHDNASMCIAPGLDNVSGPQQTRQPHLEGHQCRSAMWINPQTSIDKDHGDDPASFVMNVI